MPLSSHFHFTTHPPTYLPVLPHTFTHPPASPKNGHRSRPLDLQAVLPGNPTPCHCSCLLEGFSCRAQSQPRDAFPSLGSLFHTACLVVQLPKTVAGWKWLFLPHSQQFNTQAEATATSVQGGHCPHRPRPAKCENFCSTASASCTETHTRFNHGQRENGVPDPHTTELTLSAGYQQLPTSHTKAT